MAEISKGTKPDTPGTNPNTTSRDGGINPSAPTTGTEGWGMTRDEREVLDTHDPQGTRAGQMKGNPGDQLREAGNRAEQRATGNKSPQEGGSASRESQEASPRVSHADLRNSERDRQPLGDDQADESRRKGTSSFAMNTSHEGSDRTFRCSDMGNADCQWETRGTEEDIVSEAEKHAFQEHGADWTEALKSRVQDAIRRRRAA